MPHMFDKSSGAFSTGVNVSLGLGIAIAVFLFFYGMHLERLGTLPGATEVVLGAAKLLSAGIIGSITFGIAKRV